MSPHEACSARQAQRRLMRTADGAPPPTEELAKAGALWAVRREALAEQSCAEGRPLSD